MRDVIEGALSIDLQAAASPAGAVSPVVDALAAARRGEMLVLVDEADGGFGNLFVAAQWATASAINFMAMHARGLVCLALTKQRVQALGLPLLPHRDQSRPDTAFTVSIEAAAGVTTGISAADRAATIAVAIDPAATPNDICTPGHVFPIVAQDGGVLCRAGHAEAAVDMARLAGLREAGVICGILNDDGSVAVGEEVERFARAHGLRLVAMGDLIGHRRRSEKVVLRSYSSPIESRYGGAFAAHVYVNTATGVEHLALIKGEVGGDRPVLVGMHAIDLFDDVIECWGGRPIDELHCAMAAVGAEGRGAIVLLRDVFDLTLAERLRARGAPRGTGRRGAGSEMRDYCVGAQILSDMGIRRIISLSDTDQRMVGVEGFGLVVEGNRTLGAAMAPVCRQ
ncbi:MAG: 3,4-dihydroxy-2-butanone-4-phosphate synthase [Reyranellaceae bacterium]